MSGAPAIALPSTAPVDMADAALRYAGRGWPVLPLHTPDCGVCSCRRSDCASPGKHPRVHDGVLAATTRADLIRAWWRAWPHANVGIATGATLVVLDVDGAMGRESLRGRIVPPTPTVATGTGWHAYFHTSAPLPSRVALLPGVDVRGTGGYVVAPPSLHATGHRYAEVVGLEFAAIDLAPAPAWLTAVLQAPRTGHPPEHWRRLLRDGVAEGRRNATLASIAGHLLRRDVDPGVVAEIAAAWNEVRCRPPLADDEVERIVQSIARTEARRRATTR